MFKSCQNGNLSGMSCVAFVMMSSDGKWPVRSTRRYILSVPNMSCPPVEGARRPTCAYLSGTSRERAQHAFPAPTVIVGHSGPPIVLAKVRKSDVPKVTRCHNEVGSLTC